MESAACSLSVNLRLGIGLMRLKKLVVGLGYIGLSYVAMFALRRKLEEK